MIKLANSAVLILELLRERHGPQVFGSWFQDAVAAALDGMPRFAGCYDNRGAGQPDIKAGDTGFEVKSIAGNAIELAVNYREIRRQFGSFRLVALRTDVRPFHLWVIEMPMDPPARVTLAPRMDARTPIDQALEMELAASLSAMIAAAGTAWAEAPDRRRGGEALKVARAPWPPK
jgi:hypothetical protein